MTIDIADRGIRQGVNSVPRQLHRPVLIIIYKGVIRSGSSLQGIGAQPPVISAALLLLDLVPPRRQMPFTNISGVIPGVMEVMGHGPLISSQRNRVPVISRTCSVFSSLQHRPGRPAHRLGRNRSRCVRPRKCHPVKVRRQSAGITARPGSIRSLLVREKNNHIWFHKLLLLTFYKTVFLIIKPGSVKHGGESIGETDFYLIFSLP